MRKIPLIKDLSKSQKTITNNNKSLLELLLVIVLALKMTALYYTDQVYKYRYFFIKKNYLSILVKISGPSSKIATLCSK